MMNKKLLALLLASAMCFSLAACGSPAADSSTAPSSPGTPASDASAPVSDAGTSNVEWPGSEPVNFYVPGKAGGATDTAGRIIADFLAKKTGGTFVVMNEPTGSGTVMCETIRTSSNPDYDIAIIGSQNVTAVLAGNYEYNVRDDSQFTILSRVITGAHGNMLVCSKEAPFKTYDEMVEYGKAHPGEIRFCGSTNTLAGMYGKMILDNEGIEYRLLEADSSDALVNVLGGLADCTVVSYNNMQSYDGTGELFPLVSIRLEREEAYPDAPCFADIGLSDRYASGGQFIIASASMDPAIAQYISELLPSIVDDPEFVERAVATNNAFNVLTQKDAVQMYSDVYDMYESAQG